MLLNRCHAGNDIVLAVIDVVVFLYGTVYRQQFVKQTACIRSSASSKLIFLPCVLLTNYVFMYFTNFCNAFPVRFRVGRA